MTNKFNKSKKKITFLSTWFWCELVMCSYSLSCHIVLGFLNAPCTASFAWEWSGFKCSAGQIFTMKVFSIPFAHWMKVPYLKSLLAVLWTHFSSWGRLRTWQVPDFWSCGIWVPIPALALTRKIYLLHTKSMWKNWSK